MSERKPNRGALAGAAGVLLLAGIGWMFGLDVGGLGGPAGGSPAAERTPAADRSPETQRRPATQSGAVALDDADVERAHGAGESDVMVDGAGVVARVLADDNEGSRHQRFILEMRNGRTLLVAHNIDLAPRIDGLAVGDVVRYRGEYEFDARGGVLHWTHHDPAGRHPGGWLEHNGRRVE